MQKIELGPCFAVVFVFEMAPESNGKGERLLFKRGIPLEELACQGAGLQEVPKLKLGPCQMGAGAVLGLGRGGSEHQLAGEFCKIGECAGVRERREQAQIGFFDFGVRGIALDQAPEAPDGLRVVLALKRFRSLFEQKRGLFGRTRARIRIPRCGEGRRERDQKRAQTKKK